MFQKSSYRRKIYLSFTLIFVIIFGAGGWIFLRYNADLLMRSAEVNAENALVVVHARIDDRLRSLDSILKKIQVSHTISTLAAAIPEAPGNYFDARPVAKSELNELFLGDMISEALSTQIYFISRYCDYVGVRMAIAPYSRIKVTPEDVAGFPFVRRALSAGDYMFTVAPRQNEWLSVRESVFSVVRTVRDNYKTYGLIEISQSTSELDVLCAIEGLRDGYTVFLLDETGKQVYQKGEAALPESLSMSNDCAQGVYRSASGAYYGYHRSAYSGWILVLCSDFSAVAAAVASLRDSIALIYVISCLAIVGFFYFIAASLTKPLSRLKDHLLTIKAGEAPEAGAFKPAGGNEVSLISSQIEQILLQIRKQNELILQTRKRELLAQMRMLEAQMDPHFLYNALAVIGASAYEDGSEKAYRMLIDLADLLRYTICNEHQSVMLEEELQNIRQYLRIMQMRYENMMEVAWDLDESLNTIRVPKLVLQPLVGNCFKHGFRDQPPVWRIRIRTFALGQSWRVVISNNGKLFDPEDIRRLDGEYRQFERSILQIGEEPAAETLHFGLENTLKRLCLKYNRDAWYVINVRDGWTCVEIGGTMDA